MAWWHIVREALGWWELGLARQGLQELMALDGKDARRPESLQVRLLIEMDCRLWNAAADTARLLCAQKPTEPRFFLHAAFCLHETGDTLAARHMLLRGPKVLWTEPLFHYNMACYLAVLGDSRQARRSLRRAVEMDSSLADTAAHDEDLKSI